MENKIYDYEQKKDININNNNINNNSIQQPVVEHPDAPVVEHPDAPVVEHPDAPVVEHPVVEQYKKGLFVRLPDLLHKKIKMIAHYYEKDMQEIVVEALNKRMVEYEKQIPEVLNIIK